jgi:hypothetical protein
MVHFIVPESFSIFRRELFTMPRPISFISQTPHTLHIDGVHTVVFRQQGAAGQIGGRVWTEADSLVVDVRHHSEIALPVRIAFGMDIESDTPAIWATFGVLPGVRTRLQFPLTALNAETVFLPRTPGRLKATLFGTPTRPTDVCWFSVGIGPIGVALTAELSDLLLTDAPQPLVPDGPVLIDEMGQWKARDWPGRVSSVQELVARLHHVRAAPDPAPLPGRNGYGGSTEITFDATGNFRTHHDGQRWWLVDPEGGAFWSAGPDCVEPRAEAMVSGNETLCAWLPSSEGDFADAWEGDRLFSWPVANLIRAFGPGWRMAWLEITRRTLLGMGFNTVGNWSDLMFARGSGLPYVLPLSEFPTTTQTVFRDFPDVFSPEYAANAELFAAQLTAYAGDPCLIGYFLRNEPLWGFGAFRIAEELLRHDPQRAPFCRRALVAHLQALYAGDPARFADAWGDLLPNVEALETYRLDGAERLSSVARQDLGTFSPHMVDAYVRIPSEACRRVDPHHLNLGMRWAWIATDDLLAGSDACDVFSLNFYQMAPDIETVRKVAAVSGRPVLIGEFHFGATDRGLPANGLRCVATQADRGLAYQHFVEQAAAMPQVVGAHYFQWDDQPFLGRFDGENWQIGIIDTCLAPYPEFSQAALESHRRLYTIASGKIPPLPHPPTEVPSLGI